MYYKILGFKKSTKKLATACYLLQITKKAIGYFASNFTYPGKIIDSENNFQDLILKHF